MLYAARSTVGMTGKQLGSIVPYSELNDAKQIVSSQNRLTLPSAEELQHEMEEESRAGKAGLPGI